MTLDLAAMQVPLEDRLEHDGVTAEEAGHGELLGGGLDEHDLRQIGRQTESVVWFCATVVLRLCCTVALGRSCELRQWNGERST